MADKNEWINCIKNHKIIIIIIICKHTWMLVKKKDAYPNEYMGSWWRISETSLPDKKEIYSSLNMEDNTDADYRQAKFLCWKWYLLDLFENFRK